MIWVSGRRFDPRSATMADWLVFADEMQRTGHPLAAGLTEALKGPAFKALIECRRLTDGRAARISGKRKRISAEAAVSRLLAEAGGGFRFTNAISRVNAARNRRKRRRRK